MVGFLLFSFYISVKDRKANKFGESFDLDSVKFRCRGVEYIIFCVVPSQGSSFNCAPVSYYFDLLITDMQNYDPQVILKIITVPMRFNFIWK